MDNTTQIISILVSVLLGLIGAYPLLKSLKFQKETQTEKLLVEEDEREARVKKIEQEITERVVAMANKQIEGLEIRLEQTQVKLEITIKKVEELEKENVTLRLQNGQLRAEIKKLKECNGNGTT